MSSIFAELKRRRVYRVALAYGVIASGLIQVGGTKLPIFHAPDWAQQVFVVLIAVGFPLALALAWVFDFTAQGIQRTPDTHGSHRYGARYLLGVALAGSLVAGCAVARLAFLRFAFRVGQPRDRQTRSQQHGAKHPCILSVWSVAA